MTNISATETLLTALRKKNCSATEANTLSGLGLSDPARAMRRLAQRGLVEQHATKRGPVVNEAGHKVWRITSAGREHIRTALKATV